MPDGKAIVISSNRGPNAYGSPLYRLQIDGRAPESPGTGTARMGMIKQDGSMIAYNRALPSTGVWRKAFRGNSAPGITVLDQASLERFQNDINKYWNKKGIIIDVRFNTGGNIDEQLLDIIERRPYMYTNSCGGAPTWVRRPQQAIAGPKVMMINQRSFSDGEATPMGFRTLGLGRIVGTPTAGGVIWTGSYSLINGGSIQTPSQLAVTYDPAKPNNYGINLENFGVPPDVWVRNTPADEAKGTDRELQTAIEEVMCMLNARPAPTGDRRRPGSVLPVTD
jgi:hypothetical protein